VFRTVIATRNPICLLRTAASAPMMREAERHKSPAANHEPPRSTRVLRAPPLIQALPSAGACC
jgi:hypothetical protein